MKAISQQPNKKKPTSIKFDLGILRIANLGFAVNESFDLSATVNLSYGLKIRLNPPEEWIEITLTTIYRTQESEPPFLTSNALTKFILKDMSRYSVNGDPMNITLPDEILHTCFSITYSHARAIQMTNTSGTKFSSLVLPIVNPAELCNNIMKAVGAERVTNMNKM